MPSESDAGLNASILERLKRLEELVLGSSHSSYHTSSTLPPATSEVVIPSKTASPWASEFEEVVQSLEGTGTRDTSSWIGPRSKCFSIQILPAPEIAAVYLHTRSSGFLGQDPITQSIGKCYYLPPKEEATVFLDTYVEYIDNLQHVIYEPHIRTMMDNIYSKTKDAEQLVTGQLALLLAILASATAIYQFFPPDAPLELSNSDATHVSLFWTKAALDLLGISHRTSERRIEDIQATILLSFLLYHLEGFSVRARGLFASSMSIARDLSLHKIDAPGSQSSDLLVHTDPVSLEMKRRIFWHVVATDWLVYSNPYSEIILCLLSLRKRSHQDQSRMTHPRATAFVDLTP